MGASRASRDLPARLEGVRRRFERWRRTRKSRSRIPEPLWVSAVKVAGKYGIHRTAKALSLDYYALKQRVEGDPADNGRGEGPSATAAAQAPAATFVELPTPPWANSGECILELESPGGAKMRVHLKGFPAPDLAALSRIFCGPPS